MIELPESRHLAFQIKENLMGKTVLNVNANKSPHKFAWFSGDPELYHDKLREKKITSANAYGGIVEIMFEELCFCFCDGVNPRYFAQEEKLPDKHQLHIEFTDFSALTFSVLMYGGMWLEDEKGGFNEYSDLAKTRISPISAENTGAYFQSLLDSVKQNYSIKAFLATEQRFPGLGNGVLQDILFNAKVHPRRKLAALTQSEKEAVYYSVKKTLLEMTVSGGRNTEKDLFGCPGGYETKLSAKTKALPCPDCGDHIRREAFLGGNVYFCPTCQPYEK